MTRQRWAAAIVAVGLAVLASFVTVPGASADVVWHQSVARASATAACPDASFGSPWQADWSPAEQTWRPSWAWWPNGGTGGWTCDRQITWAKQGRSYPSAGCVSAGVLWVNFAGGWFIGTGTYYSDSSCSVVHSTARINAVYAPSGWDGVALCREALGPSVGPSPITGTALYACTPSG